MSSRFMLTAAGTASVAVGGMASAELVNFSVHFDTYYSEASWQLSNSSGALIASMASLAANGIDTASSNFSAYQSGPSIFVNFQLDLPAGDYTLAMQDTWGDGLMWAGAQGGIGVSGPVVGDSLFFAFSSGSSASGSFTVVPAPGALALLGLAGVAGRRRRG